MRKNPRLFFKTIFIAEIIICYMSVLTVISYARGPIKYEANPDDTICTPEDFVSFADAQEVQGGTLPFENSVQGEAVGWQAELELFRFDRIHVSFKLKCPAEYAGGTLFVDLYNYEEGYDSPEQEYQLVLTEGENKADFTLFPGDQRPEKAFIRFFTLDPAQYSVEELNICTEQQARKVSTAIYIGVGICFVLLISTVAAWEIYKLHVRRKEK